MYGMRNSTTIVCLLLFCFQLRAQVPVKPVQPIDPGRVIPITKPTFKWSDTAVNYKVIFRGEIGIGRDDLRSDDSELQVNVVMRNGLVVHLINNGSGTITNSGSPDLRVFHLNISGESAYVTSMDIAFVEVIHFRKSLNTNATGVERIKYDNYQPDQWDFVNIKISGRLVYTNPIDAIEKEVARREIINRSVRQKRTYGVWSSGPVSSRFDPPEEIRGALGRVAARVLTGPDGMKKDPENAAIVVQVSGGKMKDNLGRYVGLAPYSFENYDAFIKMEGKVIWRGIGKAGIFYKYGDHGLFERDDWDVKGFVIDFFPDILRSKNISFRKFSHYNANGLLVRMNGDGNGMEKWAPYF